MSSPINDLLQNASELINGVPSWLYIPLTIGFLIGIPLLLCWINYGGEND